MGIMIKSRTRDGQEVLSQHFKVYEFASVSPTPYNVSRVYSDEVKICTELVDKLELLINRLQAGTASISSGYRTTVHDKAVGGNGYGQHVLGRAVDVLFTDKSNRIIDNRIVSCVAQDLGFRGIARIDTYGYIHLDIRKSGTYFGDETKGTNTVTGDFRKYYKITNEQIAAVTGITGKTDGDTVYKGMDYADVYDRQYYYDRYPDLRQVFGDDAGALINHFVNYGMKEGRQAKVDFNVEAYKKHNPDLAAVFGQDTKIYYIHYILNGKSEGRTAQ